MRGYRTILIAALVVTVTIGATASFAGDRADWGRVMYVGDVDGAVLLIENERGIHFLVVDPNGELRTNAGQHTTLATMKPGDYIDFAVSLWAGMHIADLVVVTPRSQKKVANVR